MPATPISPLLKTSEPEPCTFGPLGSPLQLADAVSRALCNNPKTRVAWEQIRLAAAEVRLAREEYLPDLTGTAREVEDDTHTRLRDEPLLDTASRSHYPMGSLSLGWVLYDFGQRGDTLKMQRELLAAARANLDVNLQQVFLQAASDYYDAQAAQASLAVSQQIEDLAQQSVDAAHRRVEKGVAPLSDQLQAQTAHAQAVVSRIKADADLKLKRGALAIDMGLDPDLMLTLPLPDLAAGTLPVFTESLHELIEAARRAHPAVVQAEQQLAAARGAEQAARAHGWPTISLVGGLSRTDEPLTPSLGSPSVPGFVSDRSIGLQLQLPLSEPLWKRGHIAEAHARVRVQQETLLGVTQDVGHDVWVSYTQLQADTTNLDSSLELLESARASFESTQHRYEGGVGNILELLSSQTVYANAQQQRIQAVSDWRIARLALGASLGRLGLWNSEPGQ